MAAEWLDMNVDVELMIAVAKGGNCVFQFSGLAVRFAQRKILVHFEVEFHEEIAVLLVGGDVVNGVAHTLRDRADGFEEVLVVWRDGLGVNHYVGGDNLADALLDRIGQRVDAF